MQKGITPYPDVNEVLSAITKEIVDILEENLVGIYLMGSLTYDAFIPENSDLDLVVILKDPAPTQQLSLLKKMHHQIESEHQKWVKRIECSYVPLDMLPNILPPSIPRPYFGEGVFYPQATYGNEWLINQYLLYEYGIPLVGPDFKILIKPVDIKDVQQACIKDLYDEWQPKMNDAAWLSNSHYQSYLVLNLCRILYTILCGAVASKAMSAAWVKSKYPQWRPLIETAEKWRYGQEMRFQNETISFLQFIIDKVSESARIK